MEEKKRSLGNILLSNKVITRKELDQALELQERMAHKPLLTEALAELRLATCRALYESLPPEARLENIMLDEAVVTMKDVGRARDLLEKRSCGRKHLPDALIEMKSIPDETQDELARLQAERFVELGVMKKEIVQKVLDYRDRGKRKTPLGCLLIEQGFLPQEKYASAISSYAKVPYVDLSRYDIDVRTSRLLPASVVYKLQIMPVTELKHFVTVAMVYPLDYEGLKIAEGLIGRQLNSLFCTTDEFEKAFAKIYADEFVC